MKNYLLVLLSIIIFSCNKKSSDSIYNKRSKTLNYLKKEMQEQGIPGLQVVIIKNNKIVLSENLGLANVPFQ